ncbi:GNAT family N-acetyltransferase [Actinomycetospora cinnamomea]|uniref:GNAT family N-acetyltransferase n=1 Tax=Actinomycetospora cinnamomea TaxID=663609 RepID=UPI001403F06F|nr:GNAT family N-acetyltransferase [Actinomycetospora cinnamomea]
MTIDEASRDRRFLERWKDLEQAAVEPNPFFAPQFVIPAARHLARGLTVQLLVAEQDERLVFLVPLARVRPLGRRSVSGRGAWVHPYCFLGVPLMRAGADLVRVWEEIMRGGRAWRTPWIELPRTGHDGPVASAARIAADRWSTSVVSASVGDRPYVFRRPEPSYMTEWVTSKNRANLARRRRLLSRGCAEPLLTVDRAGDDVGSAVEQFLDLESRGWKGRSGTDMLSRPDAAAFFREVVTAFADDDRLVFLSLEAGDQVFAQTVALSAGAGLFGFKKAYDEEHARCSPGALLDTDVVAWFHAAQDLQWLDTCSDPGAAAGGVFGDRSTVCTLVVPVGRVGRSAVPYLFPPLFALVERLRSSPLRDRLREWRRALPRWGDRKTVPHTVPEAVAEGS